MAIARLLLSKIKNLPTQPCCGYFLHGGTRVVGLLDFGLALFATIFIASEMYQSFDSLKKLRESGQMLKHYFRVASWASYFFVLNFLTFGLSIFLFKAAKKRSSKFCKVWMILSTLTHVAVTTVFYINDYLFNISKTVHVFIVFYILYKLYCLHVVWSFVKEIESYGGFNAALSGLTDAEVEEFEKGCPPDLGKYGSDLAAQNLGFNKDFEIGTHNLEIGDYVSIHSTCNTDYFYRLAQRDQSCLLGSGSFGCVYREKLTMDSGTKSVAVKTVNPNADVAYFKTLLQELKVMTFVSHHENVVGLIGACTTNIKEKKLFVVVEFCPYGNLHEYLKARRGLFVNFVKNGEIRTDFGNMGKLGYANLNNSGNTVTTLDLFKWMHDSSKGLEFLEQKKVIHGDIATRNILLAFGKVAKISDFGLAKKLYQYTTVVKEEMLLPWRWLAIECLTDMEFSLKSDVWSFGTAIWETFSLSELPFPGFSWDKDFVNRVSNGLRMNQPRNATNDIYELMIKCWQPKPEARPSFKEVTGKLEEMLQRVSAILGSGEQTEGNKNNRGSANSARSEDEVEVYIPNQVILDTVE